MSATSSADRPNRQLHQRLDETLYRELARAQREVLLISPFVTTQVTAALKPIVKSTAASWTLLTRLDAQAIAGRFLSTSGLLELMKAGVEVRNAPRLHAKLYLADEHFAALGSANLTGGGLGSSVRSNLELSARLDPGALAEAWRIGREWVDSAAVLTEADVRSAEAAARELPRAVPLPIVDLEPLSPGRAALPAIPPDVSLWAKAQFGEPDWQQWRAPHWFSSRGDRYPGFAPGDLVVIYAKEAHRCYAVVEVTDRPTFDPDFVSAHRDDGDRWPWVNRTRPYFVPEDERGILPSELGFTGQGLQGGHKRLDMSQFLTALDLLGYRETS